MKKFLYPVLFIFMLGTSALTWITLQEWKVKEDAYEVNLRCSSFNGNLKGLKASLFFDEANLASSKFVATVDATTGNTGNGLRNKHMAQALEADKYPTIKYESSSITKKENGYETTGKLSIKDVTKVIKFPFTFEKTSTGGIFKGNFNVVTKEYNISKAGSPTDVDIELIIPVIK
jgi:polyisoprenoid-binding protein YceI